MNLNDSTSLQYYVMVDGQRLGPFDQRTVTGMRVKKILTNNHVLFDELGTQITVFELLGGMSTSSFANSSMMQTGSWLPRYDVEFVKSPFQPYGGVTFTGKGEVRVQPGVLRVAGPMKKSLWSGSREGRIKIPLEHISHVKVMGGLVQIYADESLAFDQHGGLTARFQTEDDAYEFAQFVDQAKPTPIDLTSELGASLPADALSLSNPKKMKMILSGKSSYGLWASVLLLGLVVLMALVLLLIIGVRISHTF